MDAKITPKARWKIPVIKIKFDLSVTEELQNFFFRAGYNISSKNEDSLQFYSKNTLKKFESRFKDPKIRRIFEGILSKRHNHLEFQIWSDRIKVWG